MDEVGFQIPRVGFRIPGTGFRIPKLRISDSKRKKMKASGFRIPVHGAKVEYCVLEVVSIQFFFWDHTSLFESVLRQPSPCQNNVKFPNLFAFRLKFNVAYDL